MDNFTSLIPLIKEFVMQYGLWQVSLSISIPIFIFVLPKLINAISHLIQTLK